MTFTVFLPLLLGWLGGWVVNYLADVLPLTRRLSRPQCSHCQNLYNWKDYLLFANCASCGKRRSLRSLILQAVMTVALVLIWLFPNPRLPFILAFILLAFLILVLVIDIEHRLILHPVSWSGAILGLGIGTLMNGYGATLKTGFLNTLLGGAFGFGVMLIFYFIGEAYVRYMSKKRGLPSDEVALGFGDVNLSGILGMLLGWPVIVAGLFFAILAGGLVSLVIVVKMLVSKNYRAFTAIPYAPFLILVAVFLIFL
jgi:leader peptidase (prepilin peptidase)/N-methyltransferase